MNEQALIASLKRGEAQAFSHFVGTYQHMVYRTALALVRQAPDAEDVAQEVFLSAYQSIQGFKGEAQLSTWLYRIAVTKALEWQRRQHRKKRRADVQPLDEAEQELPDAGQPSHHPGIRLEHKERAAILTAAIGRLPEQQQTAFLLAQAEQLSQAEIAAVMETTVSSVESLLFRARKKLRELLARYYETHEKQ